LSELSFTPNSNQDRLPRILYSLALSKQQTEFKMNGHRMKVEITRIDKSLPLPKYQTKGAVGCDLYARVETTVPPKAVVLIPANVIIKTPPGYMFIVTLRSSTPVMKGLLIPHGLGVGDPDFCGPKDEYHIIVYNFTNQDVIVKREERIAQGIFVPVAVAEWVEVENTDKDPVSSNRSLDEDAELY
jgi:dUTP pyrophosphatase